MGALVAAFLAGGAVVFAVMRLRLRRIEDVLTAPPTGVSTPTAAEAVERELGDDLRGYLGDVAAQHGADDAVFWVRPADDAPLEPVAWNRPGVPLRTPWGTARQRALVEWAAREGVVSFDAEGGRPAVAVARVDLSGVPTLGGADRGGALLLHAEGGITGGQAALKLWLPRHAQRLAQLVELDVTRNEVARANRHLRVLARNAQELQVTAEPAAVERRLAESVLEATGATFAALIAWNAEARTGEVRTVTSRYPEPAPARGAPVAANSLVGGVCLDGNPRLWKDARALSAAEPLFAANAPVPPAGTLAIFALQRGATNIGALVIGDPEPGAINASDLRAARLVLQLGGSALSAAWQIEDATERSRTDPLTGLGNRRHFDEQLARVLDEADRYERTCALVLADVDHFKRVNDSLGHEAGDEVLKMVAGVLRDGARSTDIWTRVGGEEFCIVLPESELAGATDFAERQRKRVEAAAVRWRGEEVRVTCSFGVATYGKSAGAVKRAQLFGRADRALYRAKQGGRNRVEPAGP